MEVERDRRVVYTEIQIGSGAIVHGGHSCA